MRRAILLAGALPFCTAFLGGVLSISLAVPSLVEAQDARIRAQQLTIASDSQAGRVSLDTANGSPDNASVSVYFADGTPAGRLAVDHGALGDETLRPKLVLDDNHGDEVITLRVSGTDGTPHLVLSDAQGRSRLHEFLDASGNPAIQLVDANGNVTWSAP